ncbi:MAG TPA: dihydrofolate reductase [Mycobacteriales bacterium]
MRALVWAQSADGVIGRDGALPWRIPEDLRLFRALTTGGTVVMGRRTWDSFPTQFRPLPGRRNIVLSSQDVAGAEVIHDLTAVPADCWVIGGARVYAATLPTADLLVTTYVDGRYDGDTWAPSVGEDWRPVTDHPWWTSSAGPSYTVVVRVRSNRVLNDPEGRRILEVVARHAADRG